MTTYFNQGTFRKAYDGAVRLAQDGTPGTIWTFPNSRIQFSSSLNNSYPDMVDASANRIDKVPGIVLGSLGISGGLKLDRGLDVWMTDSFGPRTNGLLVPQVVTLVPYSGASTETATGVYWDTLTISGRIATSGQLSMLSYAAQAIVCDPLNVLAATALAAATNEGKAGVGLSTSTRAKVTNSTGATTYDGTRSFSVTFRNFMSPIPSLYPGHEADGIYAGCTPGQFLGGLSLSQLRGATNVLPAAAGSYPISLLVPSGDASKMLTLDLSASYDGTGQSFDPTDYNTNLNAYTLFGTQASNGTNPTTGANYSFAASVA